MQYDIKSEIYKILVLPRDVILMLQVHFEIEYKYYYSKNKIKVVIVKKIQIR